MRRSDWMGAVALGAVLATGAAHAQPRVDAAAEARARALVARMTLDEKIGLLHGQFPIMMKARPPGVVSSAGYFPGIARLGVPSIRESDASLGVANAGRGADDPATALPSGLSMAATFDPELAYAGGAMIGQEARRHGFNVMLAGGVDLVRDPRNGRNFEYAGEDPFLAGTMVAASIRGIQSNHIVSTSKHYAVNDQETGRRVANSVIAPAALRESDLLAFELAVEGGKPGSVMCAYNLVNGTYACQDAKLFGVLKRDWGYPGWVMSDWGAVHSTEAALTGLDQESGAELDEQVWFGAPLKAEVQSGRIPMAKLDDMVGRVVYGMASTGLLDDPVHPRPLDLTADAAVSQRAAEAGIVLLKNEGGALPLAAGARRIVVIGGRADIGVLSGGGSTQVIPQGSIHFPAPKDLAPGWSAGVIYHPSSPLAAIRARAGGAQVSYEPGTDFASAVAAAKAADVAIVFAAQWTTEGVDASTTLPGSQDALIAAVAKANPHTVVVLETGGAVLTPWRDAPAAILEAWYPGSRGGEAIARVLFGDVDPSGRLPVTFEDSDAQLPRPKLPGLGLNPPEGVTAGKEIPFDVDYNIEGADVGYRWFQRTGARPAYPFGWGLSYTRFGYGGLKVDGGRALRVSFTVANTGARPGVEVAQVYAAPPGQMRRLVGWKRVALKPGERREVSVQADPRLIAAFDVGADDWKVAPGVYAVTVGRYAGDAQLTGRAELTGATLRP